MVITVEISICLSCYCLFLSKYNYLLQFGSTPNINNYSALLVDTVLCKSNESEMCKFHSLSLRTFVEISLDNSSVFSRCSEPYFAKTKSENSQQFRDHSENSLPEA